MQQNQPPKSSFFGMSESSSAALTVGVTLAVSMISGVSWFAFLFPLVVFGLEKSSPLVRVCAAQTFLLAVLTTAMAILSRTLPAQLAAKGLFTTMLRTTPVLFLTLLRILCLVGLVMTLARALRGTLYAIPLLTPLARNMTGYNEN